MGETFLDRHGIKSGIKLNDVIEEFEYVYKGKEVKAGDFVNYINGVASTIDYGESLDTQLSTVANSGVEISALALDENRVFIAHSYSADKHLYGLVCTINGATITYGTDTVLRGYANSGVEISLCLLPNGNVFIAHSLGQNLNLYGIVVSIDGTTITAGTDIQLNAGQYAGASLSTCLLPNGNVFIAHSSETTYKLYGLVCSINGTTITKGGDTGLSSTPYGGYKASVCLLANGNVFIAHSYGSDYYLYGMVCSISGTTITYGTDTAIVSTNKAANYISATSLENGKVFIAHTGDTNNYYLHGIVCTISGTTITVGTDTALVSTYYYGSFVATLTLNSDKVLITHGTNGNLHDTYLHGMICTISGSTITAGNDINLNTITASARNTPLKLNDDLIFVAHALDGSNQYLYAQIFGIDYDNNIPTNHITITEYEQQVTPAIEPPFNAIALSSGVGGTDTEHNEQVKIARPNVGVI